MTSPLEEARGYYAEAARAFVDLVGAIPADAWNGPGLGEWDLRALVGHTSRSLITVETYLDRPALQEDVPSAAAYYVETARYDPAAAAARGREAGQALGDDPPQAVQSIVARVLPIVEGADDLLISTIAGGMYLRNYLPTRTFELVVHGLDIAAAAGLSAPAYSDRLLAEVAEVAAGSAVLLGRGVELIRALTGRAALPDGFSVV
jgi:uncharacterized protein (TIGR03083 family)